MTIFLPTPTTQRIVWTVALMLPLGALAQAPPLLQASPQNVVNLSAESSSEATQDVLSVTLAVTRDGNEASAVQTQVREVLAGVRHFEAVFRDFRHSRLFKSSTYKRLEDFSVVARCAARGIGMKRGV